MKKNVKFLLFYVLSLAYSCQTKDFELPNEDIYVVNGLFNESYNPIIQISPSKELYPINSISPENNADVIFFENGNSLGKMEYLKNGFYRFSGYYPVPGNNYQISINVDGNELYANIKMPDVTNFTIFTNDAYTSIRTQEYYNTYTNEYLYNIDTAYYLDVNVEVDLISTNEEFFRMQILYKNPRADSMFTYHWGHIQLFENMKPELYYKGWGAEIMTDDTSDYNPNAMFKRSDMTESKIHINSVILGTPKTEYIYICLYSLTEEYYKYIKKIAEYLEFEDFDVQYEEGRLNPLGSADMPSYEPIIFPSNVTNGTGLITGLSLSVDSLKIENVLTNKVENVFIPHKED